LVEARQCVTDLLQHVNNEVREQENWRKTFDMYWQLDKRLTEHATHSVLVELRVSEQRYSSLTREIHRERSFVCDFYCDY